MVEITKLTPANTSGAATRSLRTTVPSRVVKDLGLTRDSHIKWDTVQEDGRVFVRVEPVG